MLLEEERGEVVVSEAGGLWVVVWVSCGFCTESVGMGSEEEHQQEYFVDSKEVRKE